MACADDAIVASIRVQVIDAEVVSDIKTLVMIGKVYCGRAFRPAEDAMEDMRRP